jgi:hypothetical protein
MRGLRTGHVTAVADRPLRKVLRMAGPAGPIRLSLHRRAAIATASQWMAVRTTTAHGHPIVCLVDTHAQARARTTLTRARTPALSNGQTQNKSNKDVPVTPSRIYLRLGRRRRRHCHAPLKGAAARK